VTKGFIGLWGLLAATPAFGGAWTQAPGSGYAKVWNRTLVGRNAIRADRLGATIRLDDVYQDHQLQMYGELGLAEGVTGVGYVSPVGFTRFGEERRVYVGPAWTGVRVRLARSGRVVLSIQGMAGGRPPVGDTPLFEGSQQGQPLVVRSTAATGRADAELQLGIGLNPWWLSLHGGARGFTSEAFGTAVYGYVQAGRRLGSRAVVDVHFPVYWTVREIEEIDLFGIANTRYVGFGLTGSYWITDHLSITGSFEGVAVAASNAATPSLNVGIELR